MACGNLTCSGFFNDGPVKKIFFASIKALYKWWRMLFILSEKVLPYDFLRFLLPWLLRSCGNGLIRRLSLISKNVNVTFWKKTITLLHILLISQEIKVIRPLTLVNIMWEIFFFKNHAEIETERLFPDRFLFLKTFIWSKSKRPAL